MLEYNLKHSVKVPASMSCHTDPGELRPGPQGKTTAQHSQAQVTIPVGISNDAVHQVVVEDPEATYRWMEVQINEILSGHPAKVLGMAHPVQQNDVKRVQPQ
jgi:hypothetical protein